jgi:hypothetical protein
VFYVALCGAVQRNTPDPVKGSHALKIRKDSAGERQQQFTETDIEESCDGNWKRKQVVVCRHV